MRRLLYANLATRTPASTSTGDAASLPVLYAGEEFTVALRFLDVVNGQTIEAEPEVLALRATIGRVEQPAISGTFALQYGSGSSTGSNTTPALDWSVTAPQLAGALNALSATPDDILCDAEGTGLIVWRPGGEAMTLTPRANRLSPTSFVRIRDTVRDGRHIYRIDLVQAPFAHTDSTSIVDPAPPTITTIRDGGTDPSGTWSWNEIQSLTVPADFRGTYQLKRGYARTDLLDINDGVEQIQSALNALLSLENASCRVTNPHPQKAHIEFLGDLSGANVDPLEVTVFSAPPGDITFTLDLNTWDLLHALSQTDPIEAVFEVEADLREIPGDTDSETRTVKLFSIPVTVARPAAWEGLNAAQNIDWLRPPTSTGYIPFTADQILTGQQQAFSTTCDGSGSITIDHNLSSDLCQIVVRENIAGGRLILPSEYSVVFDSPDSLTITFPTVPSAEELAVFVVSVGPASVFQTHTHTIAQVETLQDILDDLGSRVTVLEGILPSTGPGATANSSTGLITVIPEKEELVNFRGERTGSWFKDSGLDLAALPVRAPYMLPAVHDGTLTDPLPTPLPSPAAGTVWVANGRTLIPGGGGVRSSYAENDAPVASDGRILYPATRDGLTNSYYPTSFERTLFSLAINDRMLAVNRTLEVLFGIQAQLALASCQAQWVLALELGEFTADTTPATVGTNLAAVNWSAPFLVQRIVLSELCQSHFFGVRIKRKASEILMDQQVYGVWEGNNGEAPATANFALRARLVQFDTENKNDPRGWIGYRLLGALETGSDGKQTTKPAQAIIS